MKKSYLTLLSVLMICGFMFPHFARADITSNLLVHYKLDDNAANTTMTDSQGLSNGTASANTSVLHDTGKIGTGAFLFNGTTQYANTNYIWATSDHSLTITLWVKWTASSNYDILSSYNGQPGLISMQAIGGKLRGGFIDTSNNTLFPTDFNDAWNDGNWHHMAVVISGTSGTLYVDNAVVGSDSNSSFTGVMSSAGSNSILLSSEWNPPSLPFPGDIDDVCIYNRALSAADITQSYNSTTGCVAAAPTNLFTSFAVQLGTAFSVRVGTGFKTN